jgi:CspA family cold shock protein
MVARGLWMNDGNDRIEDALGAVKWFDPKKGYGFIVGPDGQDIFIHFSKIDGDGFRVLKDGAHVRYDAELTEKGWHATRCVRQDPDVNVRPRTGYTRSPRR